MISGIIAFVVIGILLGILGGGGSILAVPALVYLMGIPATLATAYSLFIVGVSAAWGAYRQRARVDFSTGIIFGLPALLAVYLTRAWLLPALPDTILQYGGFILTKDDFLLVIFALLMLAAAWSMIKKGKQRPAAKKRPGLVVAEGLVVGTLTGLVGAGGGFLILPALVVFLKMEMKQAVATSLFIIALKSTLGFLGDVQQQGALLDWTLLGGITLAAIAGMSAGSLLAHRLPGEKLKPAFGWMILAMGVWILYRQLG